MIDVEAKATERLSLIPFEEQNQEGELSTSGLSCHALRDSMCPEKRGHLCTGGLSSEFLIQVSYD